MQIADIIKKVKQIEIRTRKRTESTLMGQYHSAFKGQGMTFSEVRPYQFGDDIRRIDWNKTARFREPYVKMMEEERELTVMLLVDISASMNYGTQQQLKRELVAEICASLGFSAVGNQDKVGLILFADKVYKVIPPQKGRRHIFAIVSSILSGQYFEEKANLDTVLHYMMHVFKKKSLVFLFSDFADPMDEKLLKMVSKKHQLLGLRVFDEKDQEFPDVGYALLNDVETGQQMWVNTSEKRWRYHFKESMRKLINQTRQAFENSAASFVELSPKTDYTRILYQYFQKH